MDIISFLFAWYNLPFTTLLLLSLFLIALQFGGLGGDHDADAHLDHDVDLNHDVDLDHSVDVDHDVDLDHDVDVDHGVDLDHSVDVDHGVALDHGIDLDHDVSLDHGVDHDVDHSVDHGADHSGGTSPGFSLLAYIGVGKVPLLIVLMMLFASIGLLGWLLNGVLQTIFLGKFPSLLILVTGPAAMVGGGVLTSRVTRLLGQVLPPVSTTATRAQALVGKVGTVISPLVDEKYGMVHLRDSGGTLISIFAITEDAEPISRGTEVLLVSYDAVARRYAVTKR